MTKKWKIHIPVYVQILAGMILGIIVGMIALEAGAQPFVTDWIKPWGQVFIRLLQLVAIPLVFVSLIKGVVGLTDISRFSKIGLKVILLYIGTTLVAILVGVGLVTIIKPGNFFDSGQAAILQEGFSREVTAVVEEQQLHQGPLSFLFEIVPGNIIHAASDNRSMLQVIFFALLFGVAALSIGKKRAEPVLKLFDSLFEILLKIVDYIIRVAPFGVMALMSGLIVDFSGNMGVFGALALYAVTVIIGLLLLIFGFYPLLIRLFSKIPAGEFIRKVYPAQLVAFTTSSSAATLPVTMEVARKDLKLPDDVSSFVLPVGSTINMDGTSCYQAVAVIFIAQVLGMDLTLGQMLTIIFMTTISSIGTPSIPGGSYVILTMVLSSVGIPAQGLALILGIDRPLDMLRTAVNVTGDLAVTSIVSKNYTPPEEEKNQS